MRSSLLCVALFAILLSFDLVGGSEIHAEERWRKVRIDVPDKATLHRLIRMGVDFEGARGKPGGPVECIVSEDAFARLKTEGVTAEVLIDDLVAYYVSRLEPGPVNALGFGYGSMGGYYTLSEVRQQLDSLRLLYPNVVGKCDSIGASLQGRPIWAVRMTSNPDAPSGRPQVLYFAMQHAREPIGMMTLLYTMWYLAEHYGQDAEVTYLLDNRELWFVPVVNVDGYESNRRMNPNGGAMRRKNMRNVVTDNDANGVDLNRNWGAEWGYDDLGSSPNPLSEVYRGTLPFSEPETKVIRDFVNGKAFRFVMEYHAFWNTVFYVPGYIAGETRDSLLFRAYIRELTRHNHYSNGQSPGAYPTNGYASDWFYENPPALGPTFPFLVEVGNDNDGFWPPTSRILPLASENLQANVFAAWAGGPCARLKNCFVRDSSGNGDLEPGEAFTAQIHLHNFGQDASTLARVSASSGGAFLELTGPPVTVARLEPHADTVITLAGRVAASAPGGARASLIVIVVPGGQVEFRDTATVVLGSSSILFSDGAETGTSNWVLQQPWGRTGLAHSGGWSFTDSPEGSYGVNQKKTMTLASPVTIPLTAAAAHLQFWTRWSTEPGYDYGEVLVSSDGGTTWIPARGKRMSFYIADGYSGWEPEWVDEDIDLSDLAGRQILVRLQFTSDGGTVDDGWYVDDIVLRSYTATGSRLQEPESIAFAPTAVGEGDTLGLVLRSVGTAPLTISSLVNSVSVFALVDPPLLPCILPATLDSVMLRVAFRPQAHGRVEDTLLISSNDPVSPVMRVPLSGLGVLVGVAKEGVMYVASGSLYTLDTSSANAAFVGDLGISRMVALAVQPVTNELCGIGAVNNVLSLYRISVDHGTALPSLALPVGYALTRAMAYSPDGKLYLGTLTGALMLVDQTTGDTTLIGVAPGVKYSAMCFNPKTGELWAADYTGTRDGIVKVNTATGDTQMVGRLGEATPTTLALAFDGDGTLFALRGSPAQKNRLVRVDLSTAAGTVIDTATVAGLEAMAMRTETVPAVEPLPLAQVPVSHELYQNYPNPFNPETRIRFQMPVAGEVKLVVYDLLGREVAVLVNEHKAAGAYEARFDGRRLASGMYVYRLRAGSFVQSRKMLMQR